MATLIFIAVQEFSFVYILAVLVIFPLLIIGRRTITMSYCEISVYFLDD